ncbi:MAG: CHAT domain-containing protein, partial [Gemmatimonadaceae bacterium]
RQPALSRELFGELHAPALVRNATPAARATHATLVGGRPADAVPFRRDPAPSAVTVAVYAVLPDEMIMWVKRSNSLALHHQAISRSKVEDLVERFARSVRSGSRDALARDAADELSRVLLAPVLDAAQPGDEVVLVVDGALRRVAFAALPVGDGVLVERHPVRFAASLSATTRPGLTLPNAERSRALVIGQPTHDARAFPGLAELRYAQPEAETVAKVYTGATLATGAIPTREWLARRMPGFDVFHFAGHARIVPGRSERSHLVLAAGGKGSLEANALYASDIAALDLAGLEVAVLSACGTTTQMSRRATSLQSLAMAFLDAGARSVLSSLWEADDEATQALMSAFHQSLRTGMTAARALRVAQLGALERERRARVASHWAAFRLDER